MTVEAALLFDMTLKASLLWLAVFTLTRAARRRSAALRHDLWTAAIACCALLPLISAALRVVDPALPGAPVHRAVMAVTPSLPSGTPAGAIEWVDRIWSGDGGGIEAGWATGLLVGLWLAGAAVAVVRVLSGRRAAAAIVRGASPFLAFPAPRGARLLVTAALDAPAVFGHRSPAILLPVGAADWSEGRLSAVIAHEMAHVERRDCAIDLLVQLACALHWFNPLLWAAARALRAERELACDERVMRTGLDARCYAAALVDVARLALATPPSVLLAMTRAPELERRVLVLLARRRPTPHRGGLNGALAWSAAALFMAFAVLTTPAAGVLGPGSVQPSYGEPSGIDDPMSERVPLSYDELAATAAAVPVAGAEAAAIAALKAELGRESTGHGDLVRERAIWVLSQVRADRLFEPLAAHVADGDWRVRAYAAWGFAVAGDRRATPLLTGMLDDPVWRVRAMAAAALAELADPLAADAMGRMLADPAWQVRISAVEYVDRLGDAVLARHVQPLLDDPHAGTRQKAEEVLTRWFR